MSDNIIHVGMYGGKNPFGGREQPLEVDVIRCDKADSCSFYKEGTCLNVRSPFSPSCKFGEKQLVKGYTSRAKKYREFRDKWNSHEAYGLLEYPKKKIGYVDGVYIFRLAYVYISKGDYGWKVTDPYLGSSKVTYIDEEELTNDLLNKILSKKPQAMLGGGIKNYQDEEVPKILIHMKEVVPERFNDLIEEYPEYGKEPDHTGREAFIHTLNPSIVHYKSRTNRGLDEEWHWDGEVLTLQKGNRVIHTSIVRNFSDGQVTIKPAKDAKVVVSDNEQVNENTVFID